MWQVATATGWSVEYIMRRVNYQTLIMMLSDAPRYVGNRKRVRGDGTRTAVEEAEDVVNFFRSNLNN
ncbi:hypothetical protein [Xylanibacter muris]|uniref:hypothetical protein n=1 Tax=Xylanibacter muris TaxID=2736290 RepID=UPI0025A021E1|nr:hypothetical protein [Xylanibacter muris]